MIFSRHLLSEFIDLSKIGTEDIYNKLNAIGLEVDSLTRVAIPDNVVVGFVKECERHPDADKLSVCTVDVGNQTSTIVCGAKNVAAGQYVPVALVGASLPDGLTIKKAKLRGVESEGMICSAEELGLPKINDGIMELDESIGKLTIGAPLKDNPVLNDDVFEIDLTPNRGDCLNIMGVVRELAVSFSLSKKRIEYGTKEEGTLGIGRVLQVTHEGNIDASLLYKVVEIDHFSLPLLLALRLAWAGTLKEKPLDSLVEYVTYVTGVVMHAYSHELFLESREHDKKYWLYVKKDRQKADTVHGAKKLSTVGVMQETCSKPSTERGMMVIEASYIPPHIVSEQVMKSKAKKDDALFYRTSRGSNPALVLGVQFFTGLLQSYADATLYSGTHEVIQNYNSVSFGIDTDSVCAFIGKEVAKSQIVSILKQLEFDVDMAPDDGGILVTPPPFRHDIANEQDVVEEIVRIYGVDNVESRPLLFAETNRTRNTAYRQYEKSRYLRNRAVTAGFFETVHFLFVSSEKCDALGFERVDPELDLINPITGDLDTLRPSLFIHMLDSVKNNIHQGRKSVAFFEIGSAYNKARQEINRMAFVFSGLAEDEQLKNHGKSQPIDFFGFAEKIASVIGAFDLEPMQGEMSNLVHPYQNADILIDGKRVGYMAKLHLSVQNEWDLHETYLCEVDLDLIPYELTVVEEYSKFQAVHRDVSVLIDKSVSFSKIRGCIGELGISELTRLYPLDIFESEEIGEEKMSLTIRYTLQSLEKTLEDEMITGTTEKIVTALSESFGAELR